jgi:hypothetical protein
MGRVLLEAGVTTAVVALFTWLTMQTVAMFVDVLQRRAPRYNLRQILIFVTAAGILLSLGTMLLTLRVS